jgi:uncharacterized heparinase superfamily protein
MSKQIRTQPVTNMLNKIAAKMAQDSSKTELEIRNDSISCLIGMLHKSGLRIQDAFDTVMGEGSFDKLKGDVYDAIRAAA